MACDPQVAGMGTGTLKSTRRLPVPLPNHPAICFGVLNFAFRGPVLEVSIVFSHPEGLTNQVPVWDSWTGAPFYWCNTLRACKFKLLTVDLLIRTFPISSVCIIILSGWRLAVPVELQARPNRLVSPIPTVIWQTSLNPHTQVLYLFGCLNPVA